ncbi:hypothetical protein DM02DRAFT_630027 [Periconia macrospinosa]|uniref:Uncharacterized protein n=1 Tax=Periconia macrospinosa TaxID=97972 RepID=A0A2V1DKE2_9PLEO|nr:hypothetical protein DM02DRAFT_630027 [Periconia macrospinosa]
MSVIGSSSGDTVPKVPYLGIVYVWLPLFEFGQVGWNTVTRDRSLKEARYCEFVRGSRNNKKRSNRLKRLKLRQKAQQKVLELKEKEERKRFGVEKKERERVKAEKQAARGTEKQQKQNAKRYKQTL